MGNGHDVPTLWFDVGIKRYTTAFGKCNYDYPLWFDVGIKRYTTNSKIIAHGRSCGLM